MRGLSRTKNDSTATPLTLSSPEGRGVREKEKPRRPNEWDAAAGCGEALERFAISYRIDSTRSSIASGVSAKQLSLPLPP
jgi:hypothetical protein